MLIRNFDDYQIRPGDVKLADFGLCKDLCVPFGNLHLQCGTRSYMAPEVLKGLPYSYEVDVFPLAMITFILLTGEHPFLIQDHKLDPSLNVEKPNKNFVSLNRIRYADWRWEGYTVSPSARDFIESVGSEFPERRKQLGELLHHPFVTRQISISRAPLLPTVRGTCSESTADGNSPTDGRPLLEKNASAEGESRSEWLKELKQENRLLKFELKLRLNPTSIDHDEEDLLPVDPREGYSARSAISHMIGVLT